MISVTILTKNSEKHLANVLKALHQFDEVLIYDNGSTDSTLAIVKEFPNTVLKEGPFYGFGKTHNLTSEMAKHDWILSIDSDEILTDQLAEEIQNLTLQNDFVYSIPRKNEYQGKWIRGCGWFPDRQIKIYNKKVTKYSEKEVHEAIISKNLTVIPLKNALKHYPYGSVKDFLYKMQHYSDLFAKEHRGKKSSSPLKAALHGFFAFFKSYFLKKGFLDGSSGFLISAYNGHTAFYKYMKLYEANLLAAKGRDDKEKREII